MAVEDLGIDYANIDFTKLSTKDSYTLTEELAEYAEIRVKWNTVKRSQYHGSSHGSPNISPGFQKAAKVMKKVKSADVTEFMADRDDPWIRIAGGCFNKLCDLGYPKQHRW
uniref:Uncharacterized protein n=1 Tax=Sphaerodactylus townsendi TaxID=933632 RepID=A0ACB8FRY0_9SAUR